MKKKERLSLTVPASCRLEDVEGGALRNGCTGKFLMRATPVVPAALERARYASLGETAVRFSGSHDPRWVT